jgi:sugar/nucleoside kinase (ribokinase family)
MSMHARRTSSPPRKAAEEKLQGDAGGAADVVGMGTCTINYHALVPEAGFTEQKILSQGLEVSLGGATALSLIQLARLGVGAAWMGILGDDEEASLILRDFENDNVQTHCIERWESQRSPFTWVSIAPNGERSIIIFPNVLNYLTPEKVDAAMVGCIDGSLHFHTDVATVPLRTTLQAIEVASAADCMIFTDLDTDPIYLLEEVGIGRQKELEAILKKTDVLKSCLTAATKLTGEKDPHLACRVLHETYGSRYTVVTAGREGSCLAYNGEEYEIPVLGAPAVDPTGAGGAYFGGLSYALLMGINGEEAGYFASACAGYACSRMGALALGTLSEINAVLAGEDPSAEDDDNRD